MKKLTIAVILLIMSRLTIAQITSPSELNMNIFRYNTDCIFEAVSYSPPYWMTNSENNGAS